MYQTNRLLIRPFEDYDTHSVHSLWTDPRVDPSCAASTMELLQDKIHAQHSLLFLVVEELKTGEFVGITTLSCDGEWGIMLQPEFWSRGMGREIAEWLLHYAFDIFELGEVNLRVLEANSRAVHLYTSLGFVDIGRGRGIIQMIFTRAAWEEARVHKLESPTIDITFSASCGQTALSTIEIRPPPPSPPRNIPTVFL